MDKRFVLILLFILCFASFAAARICYNGPVPNYVALTFDDGPSPGITEMVLAVLKHEKVRATFFVVGDMIADNWQLLRQTAADGHEIGNHTFSHPKITWLTDAAALREIEATTWLIEHFTDQKVSLFRPPHGSLDAAKIRLIDRAGYHIVLWSVNADDYWRNDRGMRSSQSIAKRVLSRVRGGDIILMHDDTLQTVGSLPLIIRSLKERGFRFVTVSELVRTKAERFALLKQATLRPLNLMP